MPYIPKSKIQLKKATGNLVYKISGRRYSGPYIHTSDGKYYVGHDNINLGLELTLPQQSPSDIHSDEITDYNKYFNHSSPSRKYNNLSRKTKKYLKNKLVLPIKKELPRQNDYKRGFSVRYFAKRINDFNYFEISKSSYQSITKEDGKYDHFLYEVGNIVWQLKGIHLHKINTNTIKRAEREFPQLSYLFPVLNEYSDINGTKIQENLNTTGGELYYSDGSEYIGPYHIHPKMGPMEGATHLNTSHKMLYWTDQLPQIPNQSYEEFLHNYNKIDCFKCIVQPNGAFNISSFRNSGLIGCPADSYPTYTEANNNCPGVSQAPTDDIRFVDEMPNSSNDYSQWNIGGYAGALSGSSGTGGGY